jgi:hypothetical protein
MNRLARVAKTGVMSGVIAGLFLAASPRCGAESVCSELTVPARVEAAKGELSLADLLSHDTCSRFQQAASQVSLGAAPRAGSPRVLDGSEVRQLLAGLDEGNKDRDSNNENAPMPVRMKIPQRIVVERAATLKSCMEIAQFIASHASLPDMASPGVASQVVARSRRWMNENDLSCAGVPGVPENTPLELSRTVWNTALQRWEFALRCTRPADCVPFLVWARGQKPSPGVRADRQENAALENDPPGLHGAGAGAKTGRSTGEIRQLVEPGETVTLTWEQGGIRIVLPATCLDAGALGQFVRVRFKNASGILRAKVVGAGRLRASL